MIIGIDESGNFDENSNLRHFFVAIHIKSENNKLDIKKAQFLNWEKSIHQHFKDKKGEVKGSLLNQKQIKRFLLEVICKEPIIRTSVVSIIPNVNSKQLIEKHQKFEIQQADYNFSVFKINGSKKYNLNFLENYSAWLKKRSLRDYLKMYCLKHLLKDSVHNSIIDSILNDQIEECLNFSYKIDKDFLTEENIFWNHYSKTSIQNYTKNNPFIFLNTWDNNHPFIKKYTFSQKGKKMMNIEMIYENLRFLESHTNFEIRIADIIGIIYNRYFNRNELSDEFNLLSKTGIVNDHHIELILNDFDEEKTFKGFIS